MGVPSLSQELNFKGHKTEIQAVNCLPMDHIATVTSVIWLLRISSLLLNGQTTAITLPKSLNDSETTTLSVATTAPPYTGCKVNEVNSPPSQHCQNWCGEQIMNAYSSACDNTQKRKKRGMRRLSQIGMDRKEASKFLKASSYRSKFSRVKRSTDIVEECCYEGCVSEEVHEYC
ncbi:uncharacterized protein [Acropora muricata]|uniref:uncharacterized protein LOC114960006 n=1 Tax=Acropora millepora TaxID=45264 RepID=UPI001CF37C08|nr:uncharacterized protein LOC114960006 [Acropora millepora]